MRVALFSDIHGNFTGLQAVLAAIDAGGGADLLIAAGDHVSGGSGGDDLIELLAVHGVHLIRGDSDTDDKLVQAAHQATEQPGSTRSPAWFYNDMRAWLHEYVSATNRAMLEALPLDMWVDMGDGARLYVCHASPRAIGDRICAPLTHPAIVRDAYGAIDASVIAFGHWHAPYVRQLDGTLYINVASVGWRDDGLSRYTMLTYQDGQVIVEQHAVPYDVAAESQRMHERGVPHTVT